MIAHDQRYALSINILLLPLLIPGAIMASELALEEPGSSPVRGHPVIVERGRSQDYSYVLFFFFTVVSFSFPLL